MRNLFSVEDILDRAYRENATIVNGVPSGNEFVPRLLPRVLRIQDAVPVDHFLPGCPPSADTIFEFVTGLLAGRAPAFAGARFGS